MEPFPLENLPLLCGHFNFREVSEHSGLLCIAGLPSAPERAPAVTAFVLHTLQTSYLGNLFNAAAMSGTVGAP